MTEKFEVITPKYKVLQAIEIEDVVGSAEFVHAAVCDCAPGGDPMDKNFAMNLYCADNWLNAVRERQARISALKLLLQNYVNDASAEVLDEISIATSPPDSPLRTKSALSGEEPTTEELVLYGKWLVGENLREQATFLRQRKPF